VPCRTADPEYLAAAVSRLAMINLSTSEAGLVTILDTVD
jgi:hypothetical protein